MLVLWDIEPTGHGDLDEHHFVAVVGMLIQELLKGKQLLWNSLDDVQAVYAEHDLQALIPVCTSECIADLVMSTSQSYVKHRAKWD
jgi:hypothetical protein